MCFYGLVLGGKSATESLLTTIAAGTQPFPNADQHISTKPNPPTAAKLLSPTHVLTQPVELIS